MAPNSRGEANIKHKCIDLLFAYQPLFERCKKLGLSVKDTREIIYQIWTKKFI